MYKSSILRSIHVRRTLNIGLHRTPPPNPYPDGIQTLKDPKFGKHDGVRWTAKWTVLLWTVVQNNFSQYLPYTEKVEAGWPTST